MLNLGSFKPTPVVLELTDQSTTRPVGKMEDVIISLDSWEYSVDLSVIHTQSQVGVNPMILERPWLVVVYAYIGCLSGNMVIPNGEIMKNLILYPLVQRNSLVKLGFIMEQDSPFWDEFEPKHEDVRIILNIGKDLYFKGEMEDDSISTFISNPNFVSCPNQ